MHRKKTVQPQQAQAGQQAQQCRQCGSKKARTEDIHKGVSRLRPFYQQRAPFGDQHWQHDQQQAIDAKRGQVLAPQQPQAKLGGKASFVPVEGGMFLWLTLPGGVDTPAFVKKCLDRRLALVPGSAFFVDDAAPCQSMRCNFSTPTDEQIDRGTTIMAEVLDEMMA